VELFDDLRFEIQPVVNHVVKHFGELNELLSMLPTTQYLLTSTKQSPDADVLKATCCGGGGRGGVTLHYFLYFFVKESGFFNFPPAPK